LHREESRWVLPSANLHEIDRHSPFAYAFLIYLSLLIVVAHFLSGFFHTWADNWWWTHETVFVVVVVAVAVDFKSGKGILGGGRERDVASDR
jgi:hypothetical protein